MLVTLLQLFKITGQYLIEIHPWFFRIFHITLKRLYSNQKYIFKVFTSRIHQVLKVQAMCQDSAEKQNQQGVCVCVCVREREGNEGQRRVFHYKELALCDYGG